VILGVFWSWSRIINNSEQRKGIPKRKSARAPSVYIFNQKPASLKFGFLILRLWQLGYREGYSVSTSVPSHLTQPPNASTITTYPIKFSESTEPDRYLVSHTTQISTQYPYIHFQLTATGLSSQYLQFNGKLLSQPLSISIKQQWARCQHHTHKSKNTQSPTNPNLLQ